MIKLKQLLNEVTEYSDLDPFSGFSDKTLRGALMSKLNISPTDLKAKEDLEKLSRAELEKKLRSLRGNTTGPNWREADRKFTSAKELKSAIDNLSDDDTDYVLIPSSLEVDGEFDKIYANGSTWKDSVKTEIDKTLSQQDPRTVGVKYFYLYQGSPGVYSIEFL